MSSVSDLFADAQLITFTDDFHCVDNHRPLSPGAVSHLVRSPYREFTLAPVVWVRFTGVPYTNAGDRQLVISG
uniref:hypothetical protein n=1 Tax=Gordonia sp. B7-2 TaxID=3420932 RepID=UPI003D91F42B